MKNTIVIILSTISLSGCVYQSVDHHDIQRATKVCGSIENVANIAADFIGQEFVMCYDSNVRKAI